MGSNPGPGSRLQREREKRGMSALEVAEKLHLDPAAIGAMESNCFDSLGPVVYAKGHLRQYAILLNLSPAEILAAYEATRQEAVVTPLQAPPPPIESPKTPSKLFLPIAGALIVATFIAGALIAWKPWRTTVTHGAAQVAGTVSGGAGAALSDNGLTAAQDLPETTGAAAPSAAVSPANPGMPTTAVPPGTQGVGRAHLRMSFSAESWVEIHEAGGATLYRGKGPANSVKIVSGLAPLSVYLGYVSGVQLEINSHAVAIGPQFVRGDVARFDAGADGVLRRSPRT